jgi:hypothetical protein
VFKLHVPVKGKHSTGSKKRRFRIAEFVVVIIGILSTVAVFIYFDFFHGSASACRRYSFDGVCFNSRQYDGYCFVMPCCTSDSIYHKGYCYSDPDSSSTTCRYVVRWTCCSDRYEYPINCTSGRCCSPYQIYDSGHCYFNASSAWMSQTMLAGTCQYRINGDCYSSRYFSYSVYGCPSNALYIAFEKFCYLGIETTAASNRSITVTPSSKSSVSSRILAANSSATGALSACAFYPVFSLCFRQRRNSRLYDNAPCTDVFYGTSSTGVYSYCCRSDEYFHLGDEYCYSDLVDHYVSNTSASCRYVAYGVCYSNRYFHGPCLYDVCCRSGVACNPSHGDLNNVICQSSRCCALDETYYDYYCYYNGTENRTVLDPISYSFEGKRYVGRFFTGPCKKGRNFCAFSGYQCYQNHCYSERPVGL